MSSVRARPKMKNGWYSRGYLPHFDGGPIPQHVTFRLADSFAGNCLKMWKTELTALDQAKPERRRRIEVYLAKGYGLPWLADPAVAEITSKALLHFDGQRYCLHAWCIMPNHVHVLLTRKQDQCLSEIVHSWKSYSANKANAVLGRTGSFWAREYYDRCIRDAAHFESAVKYIENNPVKAGLCEFAEQWPYSSAFQTE